jgi:hypothetical protein
VSNSAIRLHKSVQQICPKFTYQICPLLCQQINLTGPPEVKRAVAIDPSLKQIPRSPGARPSPWSGAGQQRAHSRSLGVANGPAHCGERGSTRANPDGARAWASAAASPFFFVDQHDRIGSVEQRGGGGFLRRPIRGSQRREQLRIGSGCCPPFLFLWSSARFRETSGRWPFSKIRSGCEIALTDRIWA